MSSSETETVGIRHLKYNSRWESPCVTGFSPQLTGNVTPMIDTGAEVNLLKKKCIKPSAKIDGTDLLLLTRVTLKKQSTLGTLIIRIFEEDVLFHVVDENFPIHFDGILGMDFLGSRSAIIDNTLGCLNFKNMSVRFSRSESFCLPSRSYKISYCYVKNLEISEGYMPLLRLPAGIYASEALIKNNNGKGCFRITNTTSKQYMFEILRLELSDFSEDTLLNSGSDTSNKTTDPDSSEILSFIYTIFTEKNGEECPKLNTLEFETKDNQTDDEDSDIEIDIDNIKILDQTAGEVNDLTESLCALTDTGETGGVCSDTGKVLPKNNIKISYKNRTRIVHKDKVKICAK
ncbi:hypothetical protein M0804_013739 [Polistes exclamans]|nr:hypothetical protein M0804_013739 [Polistes exclamans]